MNFGSAVTTVRYVVDAQSGIVGGDAGFAGLAGPRPGDGAG